MAFSMTGFGRGEITAAHVGTIVVEIKTLNHRYLDIVLRAPKEFHMLEQTLRGLIRETFTRGRVEVFLRFTPSSDQVPALKLNMAMARAYLQQARLLEKETDTASGIEVKDLLRLPEVISLEETSVSVDLLRAPLLEAAGAALSQIYDMRRQEGKKMVADIRGRLLNIKDLLDGVEDRSPTVVEAYAARLKERLQEILAQGIVDEARLAQEIAFLADKACIAEEIVRLRSHFQQLESLLLQEMAKGRQLDFLVQEMNREINTIGSKANDAEIAHKVVEMKSELEKIREQVQNIE